MKALFATGIMALALVGCNNMPHKPSQPAPQQKPHDHHHHSMPMTKKFVCENDAEPVIRTLNHDQIELTVDGKATVMNAAVSGSGERYVSATGVYGKGGEWHQKGDTAIFTYHDYGSPTNCRAK